MKLKSALEYTVNILLVIVCILIITLFVTHRPALTSAPYSSQARPSLNGMTIAPIPNHPWNSNGMTLVMAIRQGCHFCQASMPFYHHLSELQQAKQLKSSLLLVMPDKEATVKNDLSTNGVNIEGVYGNSLSSVSVSATPTLLLIDPHGRIEQSWVGQLPAADENEVIAALEK